MSPASEAERRQDHALEDTLARTLAGARIVHAMLGGPAASNADGTPTLLVSHEDFTRADAALRSIGFVAASAADGTGGDHYVGYDADTGTWTSVSVVADPSCGSGARDRASHARAGRAWNGRLAALRRTLVRLRAPWGRRGLVVALVGPDGAGKTTLARTLECEVPLRARRIYMGTNREAGDALAIGRWVARRRAALGDRDRGAARLALLALGAVAHLAEQRYRHALALRHRARGGIVVFDRYALDLVVNERLQRAPVTATRRLRNWLLHAGAPRPDLVLVLDAPGEVLYARKGEHSPDYLERMRQAYSGIGRGHPTVVVIDAARDARAVGRAVTSLLWTRTAQRVAGRAERP